MKESRTPGLEASKHESVATVDGPVRRRLQKQRPSYDLKCARPNAGDDHHLPDVVEMEVDEPRVIEYSTETKMTPQDLQLANGPF